MKYRCIACGYIYDEDAEGTKLRKGLMYERIKIK